jgi:hypothetical protein
VIRAGVDLISGVWAGHYEQAGRKFPQKMTLEFADGLVRGDGVDLVGTFTLDGEYRIENGVARIGWIKTYDGAHSVRYLGVLENGVITGRWRIEWFEDRFALEPVRDNSPATKAEGKPKA